ncbi:MAG: hydroxypyruvate isomerase, partial [Sphingobacteriaceae bacterium]
MMSHDQNRRSAIKNILTGTAAVAASGSIASFTSPKMDSDFALKGNINHSACRWCYSDIALDELCIQAKKIG